MVVGFQHVDGFHVSRRILGPVRHHLRPADRTHLLAVVTPIEPTAEGLPVHTRNGPGCLDQPRQAPPGVDHPRLHDGPGRTAVDAPPAGSATLVDRVRWRQCGIRHHGAEDEPAAPPGEQDVGVAAVPPDPGPDGCRPVHQGVVVGHDPGRPSISPEAVGQVVEAGTECSVVVVSGVGGDPEAAGTDIGQARCRGPSGSYEDGPRTLQNPPRVGRPGRVAEGELHSAVQALRSTSLQL